METPAERAETATAVSNLVKSCRESKYADESCVDALDVWRHLPRLDHVPWVAETAASEATAAPDLATPASTSDPTATQTAGDAAATGLVDFDDQASYNDNWSLGSGLEPPADSVGARQAAGQLMRFKQPHRSKSITEPPPNDQHKVWQESVPAELCTTSLTEVEAQLVVRKDAAGNVPRHIKERLAIGSVRICCVEYSRYRQSTLEIPEWIDSGNGCLDLDAFLEWIKATYPSTEAIIQFIDSMTQSNEYNLPLEYKKETFSGVTLIRTNRGDRHALDSRTYAWLLFKTGNKERRCDLRTNPPCQVCKNMTKRARTIRKKSLNDTFVLLEKDGGEELLIATLTDPKNRSSVVTLNQFKLNLLRFQQLEKKYSRIVGVTSTRVDSIELVNHMVNTIEDYDKKKGVH